MNAPADREAYLRAALHSATDSLEPRGDGLERIRTRLQHARPRAVIWLLAAWDAFQLRVPAALQDAFHRLSAGFLTVRDRFTPGSTAGKHRSRTEGWLRPLAAMAVAIFIVAAGSYVAIGVSTAAAPSSSNVHPRTGQQGPGSGHPAISPAPPASHSASTSGSGVRRSSPSPSCLTPSTSPQPSDSVPASPSVSPSPTSTGSGTPTPTPSSSSSPSNATTVASAVRLTAVATVAGRTAARVAQASCGQQSTSPATPEPSAS